jgi:transporter family protein
MAWLAPTLYYVACVGALGVTSRLALRDLAWQDLILWSGLGYVVVVVALLALGQTSMSIVAGTGWAVGSAVLAISGLIAFYVALNAGQASVVVPITAAYPAVTAILAAAFLDEPLSVAKVVGIALVVGGVVVLTSVG